jgi:hypothetical protein
MAGIELAVCVQNTDDGPLDIVLVKSALFQKSATVKLRKACVTVTG